MPTPARLRKFCDLRCYTALAEETTCMLKDVESRLVNPSVTLSSYLSRFTNESITALICLDEADKTLITEDSEKRLRLQKESKKHIRRMKAVLNLMVLYDVNNLVGCAHFNSNLDGICSMIDNWVKSDRDKALSGNCQ